MELEQWLNGSLAHSLGLDFLKIYYHSSAESARYAFSRARVIFAPHGGVLSNLAFAHESTVVVEFQPKRNLRLCYACMAYAMRFHSYAVFIPNGPEQWININRGGYTLSLSAIKDFWKDKIEAEYHLLNSL